MAGTVLAAIGGCRAGQSTSPIARTSTRGSIGSTRPTAPPGAGSRPLERESLRMSSRPESRYGSADVGTAVTHPAIASPVTACTWPRGSRNDEPRRRPDPLSLQLPLWRRWHRRSALLLLRPRAPPPVQRDVSLDHCRHDLCAGAPGLQRRPPVRLSSALVWPYRERWSGDTVWLSVGQRTLLFWIHARHAKGHHTFTLDQAARAVGIDRSNVSRGLDRLASLSLVGRRSSRGRLGITTTWKLHKARALTGRAQRSRWPTGNVATSTPYGGYLSREGYFRAVSDPSVRRGSARRLAPPRLLYARCPAGHRVRTARWFHRRSPDGLRLSGSWKGWCRRCAAPVVQAVDVTWVPDPEAGWVRAGTVARRVVPPPRAPA